MTTAADEPSFATASPPAGSHGVTLPSASHARTSVLGPSFADPPTFVGADSGRSIDASCAAGTAVVA